MEPAMAWPTRTVDSWRAFTTFVDSISTVATPRSVGYLFRGQSDAGWSLTPSLARLCAKLESRAVIDVEKIAFAEFRSSMTGHSGESLIAVTSGRRSRRACSPQFHAD